MATFKKYIYPPMESLGFSFLELLISLSIVSILAVSSAFTVRFILTNSRLKSAADTFAQQLRLARSEAIQQQQNVYFHLQSGSDWCYGSNVASDCNCSPTNTCGLSSISGSSYKNVIIATTGFTPGSIYFDSVRGLPSETSSVSFQINDKVITVSINSLGKISKCSTNVTGYPTC